MIKILMINATSLIKPLMKTITRFQWGENKLKLSGRIRSN